MNKGALVVGDRWIYGYVGQPDALGYSGPVWLAKLAVRLAPRPDFLLLLTADPGLISLRKSDLSRPEIEAELLTWREIPLSIWEVDASEDPSTLAESLVKRIGSAITPSHDS